MVDLRKLHTEKSTAFPEQMAIPTLTFHVKRIILEWISVDSFSPPHLSRQQGEKMELPEYAMGLTQSLCSLGHIS